MQHVLSKIDLSEFMSSIQYSAGLTFEHIKINISAPLYANRYMAWNQLIY